MGAIGEGLAEYARPLIDMTDGSEMQVRKAFSLAMVCHNISLLPKEERAASFEQMKQSLQMDEAKFDDFRRSVLEPMMTRHEDLFPLFHPRTAVQPSRSMASPGLPSRLAQPMERRPVIDRYGPCPCGSGEKFKFCCDQTPLTACGRSVSVGGSFEDATVESVFRTWAGRISVCDGSNQATPDRATSGEFWLKSARWKLHNNL
jgi:hypothetical protein